MNFTQTNKLEQLPLELVELLGRYSEDISFICLYSVSKKLRLACQNIERKPLHKTCICSTIALRGDLEILKWARANGYPWNEWTCSYAAEGGYLEILKWARGNGCPWDESTCSNAAQGGHLEVLKWARDNGCPWDDMDLCSCC